MVTTAIECVLDPHTKVAAAAERVRLIRAFVRTYLAPTLPRL